MFRLIVFLAFLASLPTPRVVTNECKGHAIQQGGTLHLDCRNPCQAYCRTGIDVLPNVGNYAYCLCTGGSEDRCCQVCLLLATVPPLPMTKGKCSAQDSSCPTGNERLDGHVQLEDAIVDDSHCGNP